MSTEQVEALICDWDKKQFNGKYFEMYAIVADEKIVGTISLYQHSSEVVSIGPDVFCKFRRKGFAKEAAKAVRDWVFLNTQYDIIYSYMKYTNVGSYSTAIANGMQKVKEYPDPKNTIFYAYAITREEWKEMKEE